MKITVEEFIELSDALVKAIDSVRDQKYMGIHSRIGKLEEIVEAHCHSEILTQKE